jgi:adenylate cyclase
LHAGEFWLGNIGAFKRYEYRPVGDTVNTASRLEKLNRHLNTRILVSYEVIKDLTEFLVRKIGNFKLAGKSAPVAVYELLGTRGEADSHLENLCSHFSAGLDAYADMCFDDAFKLFCETSKRYSDDGPSCFYMQLCEKFRKNPPEEMWNGLILMEEK